MRRWLLIVGGSVALVLGAIGVVLPGLPTTPFVLLAAWCFARSSPELHGRLVRNRVFGPLIVDWETSRSIPMRAKVMAVATILLSGGLLLGFVLSQLWARLALAAIFCCVIAWIVSRPTAVR